MADIGQVIESSKLVISVIGIGRIGLPTAVFFARAGFQTIGVDINPDLVKIVNSGQWPLKDEPGFQELFEDVTKKNKLL
ncbi:MAG: nucleotide sugar dehydrogenase, partial [Thaumarchaeota archaeon]